MQKIKTTKLATRLLEITFIFCLILPCNSFSQTRSEQKIAKQKFEGTWVNKKTKRHLSISFDFPEYVLINDWAGKNSSIDAYKAFIIKDKLIMPEDKTDLRSPYCEILKKGEALIYRCIQVDIRHKKSIDEIWFIRQKN